MGAVYNNELGPTRTNMRYFLKKKMKRTRCDSTCDQLAKKARHKIEYDKHWKEFPWHVPVYNEEGNSESCVVGLLCSICQRHGRKQRN